MDDITALLHGFTIAATPVNLLMALIGAFVGTIVGLLPGIGPINGVAILLPIAFAMKVPATSALILLASVYMGCEYGGRITSILVNIPGDAGSVMTTLDGFPMAKKGEAGIALSISAFASFCGSLLGCFGLVFLAPLLAKWALAFGPAEYFVLMVFAIACLAGMVGDSPVKTLLACVLGLALATVGIDSNSGVYRFTFGDVHLSDGIQFVVIVIGLFSVSEILLMLEQTETGGAMLKASGRAWFNLKELSMVKWTIARSAPLGFIVGVLPGAGASIASAIAYMIEKNVNDSDRTFGKGDIRGVAAPESANNGAAGGAFIPMLTLGVPGSGTTAVMMGALTLYNINPGPTLFTDQADLVWGLIASLFIANFMLLLMNIPMVGLFARMLTIPNWILVPAIVAISMIGVYSIHATTFDLVLMTALGVVGWVLRKLDFPMAPLILGFVLGDMMEQNLRRALAISNGDTSVLYGGGITITLWVAAVFMLVVPLLLRWKRNNKLIEVK